MGVSAFQTVTLAAAFEVLLFAKVLPNHLRLAFQHAPLLSIMATIFGVNYGVLFFYNVAIYPIFVDPLRKFPGLKYGYWYSLKVMYNRFTHKEIRAQLYMTLARETPNDGVLALRGLGATSLLLTKPATISTVLVNQRLDYIKPPITRKFLRVIIGDGLILAEGEEHKFLRKKIQPAFTPRHIKNLYPMMWKKARVMTDAIAEDIKHRAGGDEVKKDAIPTGTVDMCYWALRVSLDIIGQAGLGHDFNSLKNSDDQLSKDYGTIMEPSMEKMLWFFLNSRLSYHVVQMLPWHLNTLMRQRISSVQRISNELVLDKRNAIEEKGEDHFDVLSLLIKSNNFSDSQLKDQLLTFLAAGHETTSSAFIWSCYLLATHQDMQTTLRTEVRIALSAAEPSDLCSVMESLPYLNGVMHETLRIYPTAPILFRVAAVDTHLLGNWVPRGTRVVIPPWIMNRSPELWGEDAEEFRPQRWIDANGRPNSTGGGKISILTFLHGARGCIGENFSKAELRCLIASMVSQFEWTLDMPKDDVVPAGAITIRPANGLHLKLKEVKA